MKTITNIDECNKVLKDFNGASAQIWLFHITHKRLALRIWLWSEAEHQVQKEIYIVALGCEHIVGGFFLENANLLIVKTNNEFSEPIYKIIDENSDFELIANAGIGLLDSIDWNNG
ncbi:hypothetical protein FAM09_29800 [Niastella caeni]|uniref:Uncharacterized protein n=1 Tax=Niastella caeni TaxID=2569763 RepID=A0A4S8H847_9BACT|nr:hypothetical protein [Niastella caeni]THU30797.1 hypothetical protein FAM09_29800 [Niastella caeni]